MHTDNTWRTSCLSVRAQFRRLIKWTFRCRTLTHTPTHEEARKDSTRATYFHTPHTRATNRKERKPGVSTGISEWRSPTCSCVASGSLEHHSLSPSALTSMLHLEDVGREKRKRSRPAAMTRSTNSRQLIYMKLSPSQFSRTVVFRTRRECPDQELHLCYFWQRLMYHSLLCWETCLIKSGKHSRCMF